MTAVAAVNGLWAAHIVRSLLDAGVKHFVVSPGSRSTPITLAIAKSESDTGVKVSVVLDERVAAFVALGSTVAGCRAALLCTSGTAGAHYLPAVIEASYAGVPLVVCTANRPPELHGCGAPQTIDQASLYAPYVRARFAFGPPESGALPKLKQLEVQAFEDPGPIHLDFAFREPLWSEEVEAGLFEAPAHRSGLPDGQPFIDRPAIRAALLEVIGLRELPQRTLVVAGARAALLAGPAPAGWAVLADAASNLRALSTCVSAYDAILRVPSLMSRLKPDLILCAGAVPASRQAQDFLSRTDGPMKILLGRHHESQDPGRTASGHVDVALTAMLDALCEAPPASDFIAAWQLAEETARTTLDAACREGFWSGAVVSTLDSELGARPVHLASSMPIRDFDHFTGRAPIGRRVFAHRGTNGIDGTIASSLGESLALGGATVTVLLGDVAYQHDLGSLAATRGLEIRLVLVVVNNGGGAIFGHLGISRHPSAFERFFLTPPQVDIEATARACGASHVGVTDRTSLASALRAAYADTSFGVTVIECRVDRRYDEVRHKDAHAAASTALTNLKL